MVNDYLNLKFSLDIPILFSYVKLVALAYRLPYKRELPDHGYC